MLTLLTSSSHNDQFQLYESQAKTTIQHPGKMGPKMQLPDNVVVHEPKVRSQGLWPLTVESSDQEKCSSTQRLWHRMLRWRVYPSLLYECTIHFIAL